MRAAQAADRSVQLAETVAGAQLRAYLFPGKFTLVAQSSGNYRIGVPIRNSGQTPARDVAIRVGRDIVVCPLPSPLPEILLADPLNFHAIAPGTERSVTLDFALSDVEIARITASEAAVVCRIRYSYRTHDGRVIEEPVFDMMASGENFATDRMTVIPRGDSGHATQVEPG